MAEDKEVKEIRIEVVAQEHTEGFLPLRQEWFEIKGGNEVCQCSVPVGSSHLVFETTKGNFTVNIMDIAEAIMEDEDV